MNCNILSTNTHILTYQTCHLDRAFKNSFTHAYAAVANKLWNILRALKLHTTVQLFKTNKVILFYENVPLNALLRVTNP